MILWYYTWNGRSHLKGRFPPQLWGVCSAPLPRLWGQGVEHTKFSLTLLREKIVMTKSCKSREKHDFSTCKLVLKLKCVIWSQEEIHFHPSVEDTLIYNSCKHSSQKKIETNQKIAKCQKDVLVIKHKRTDICRKEYKCIKNHLLLTSTV